MKQLVELHKAESSIKERGAEVVAVFREENLGVEGLKKSHEKTECKCAMLIDPKSKATKDYSVKGFHTYIIDEEGIVRSVLTGTKLKRPSAKKILAELDKLPKLTAKPVNEAP